jgi:synaptic vesicle membrane protein VAT-1
MKQVVITRAGGPEVLEVREKADPEPGPGEVRVKVEAAGINFADLMARMGIYQDAPPLPTVVGYEVAGTIDQVGPGVDRSRVGQPVVAPTRFGGYSSLVIVKNEQAILRPPGLDAEHAAAIPVTGLTAWMMVEEMGRVRQGDRVLVHSAGGGVGLMALDLIKRRGGIAVGTASAKKHPELKALGYDELVDYTTQDFEAVLSKGAPFDLVLDPVGGESWAKGFRLLRTGGRMICFGFSTQAGGEKASLLGTIKSVASIPWLLFNPISMINSNKGLMGVNMGNMWQEGERLGVWLSHLLALWQKGQLRPRVHATYPFSRAAEAHRSIHERSNLGKVLLIPD